MASITGLTAARMLEIEAASVVDGDVINNDLVLTTHGGVVINAGNVRGTRWGTTTVFVFNPVPNALVYFADGQPPRIGDLVVSNNGLGPGLVSKVTAVVDASHADLADAGLSLRGAAGTPADETAIRAYADGQDLLAIASAKASISIAAGTDLNNMKTEGNYKQDTSANATLALHYPEVTGGLLEVFGSTIVYQRYTTLTSGASKVYQRLFSSTVWGAWVRLLGDTNSITTLSSIKAGTTLDMGGAFYQQGFVQPRLHKMTHAGAVTNTVGQLVFNHGAPFTPTAGFIINTNSSNYFGLAWGSSAFTTTACTFRWINASTAGNLNAINTGPFTAIFVA